MTYPFTVVVMRPRRVMEAYNITEDDTCAARMYIACVNASKNDVNEARERACREAFNADKSMSRDWPREDRAIMQHVSVHEYEAALVFAGHPTLSYIA